jgi:hypothetical protein
MVAGVLRRTVRRWALYSPTSVGVTALALNGSPVESLNYFANAIRS